MNDVTTMPAADYHALPHASSHRLHVFRTYTPAHARYEMDHPTPQTPAMAIGEAVHVAVLEPARFHHLYLPPLSCSAIKKDGTVCANDATKFIGGTWLCGVHGKGENESTATILSSDDWDRIHRISEAVNESESASKLIRLCDRREVVMQWEDVDGVKCKARMDAVGNGIILDLKTSRDIRPDAFRRDLFRLGYLHQAAFYRRGAARCGLEIDDSVIIAVENDAKSAIGCRVYRIKDDLLALADQQITNDLRRWGECERSGVWPGYSDDIEEIGVTAWDYQSLETNSTEGNDSNG